MTTPYMENIGPIYMCLGKTEIINDNTTIRDSNLNIFNGLFDAYLFNGMSGEGVQSGI